MKVVDANNMAAERLQEIESLSDNAFSHYIRVEKAVAEASIEDLQGHYAYLHGLLPEDVIDDARFPWHPEYRYGDSKKCCENCEELEMALSVLIDPNHPLLKSLPEFRKLTDEIAAS